MDWYGTSNAKALPALFKQFNDPNLKLEVHVYFDSDSGGTTPTCMSGSIGSERLAKVTPWLKQNGIKALLTEFAASSDATCLKALDDTLNYLTRKQLDL